MSKARDLANGRTVSTEGGSTVTASGAAVKPIILKGATSQSANLLELQNSSGSAITFFNSSGGLTGTEGVISTLYSGGKMTTGTLGYLNATTFSAAVIPIVARGTTSQSADLQQWQNSAGTAVASIDSNGAFTATVSDATTTTAARGAGYMGIPQSSAATTGSYTIVAADAGEHIYSTATRTITIPANSSVAFPVGTAISFVAATGATVTIAITTDTLLLAGPGTTGSRTLAAFGMATALKITSTSWIISGNGLT